MKKKQAIIALLGVAIAAFGFGACAKSSGGGGEPPRDAKEIVDFLVDVEEGRDIRILQLSDTQIIDPSQKRYADRIPSSYEMNDFLLYDTCYRYIENAIETTNPDLIMLTGDIIYGEFDDSGEIFSKLVSYIDSFDIPWAPVYGNHDNESKKGVSWQNQQFIDAENCLFKKGTVTGNGNYTIGITQGDKLVKVVYMMDSNGCASAFSDSWTENGETVTIEYNQGENIKTTAGFAQDQIDWLSETAAAITQSTNGEVSSMIAFHIPIAEFADGVYEAGYQDDNSFANSETYEIGVDVEAKNGDFGYKGEQFKGIHYEYGLWDIFKANNFDGVFCGHSHNNSVSVLYDGVRLTFGLKTGTNDRHIKERLGGTLICVDENGELDVSHAYYDLNFSGVNYDFSTANDKDIKTVGSYGSGIINGIVQDEEATDGYALKGTSITNGSPSGIQISFDDVDLTKYSRIKVRARIEGDAMGFYINDVYVVWCNSTAYASYQEIDVISYLQSVQELAGTTTLTSIAFGRKSLSGQTVYIDSVTFIEKKAYDYQFSSTTDDDLETVLTYHGGTVDGIVADAGASDGYALKGTSITDFSNASGIKVNFDNVDLSKYSSIKVRFRIEGDAMGFYINDVYVVWCNSTTYATYGEIDIIEKVSSVADLSGTTTLNSIAFGRKSLSGQTVYIDSITFTTVD